MIGKSLTLILLLSVFSSIHAKPDPADMLNHICEVSMKSIKAGTFEKEIKEKQECREKVVPKDVLAAVAKCEETLPMSTVDQITKICLAKDANASKFSEKSECEKKAVGDELMPKFAECCKKMDPDNAKKSS